MAIIKIGNPAIDLDAAEIPNIDASKITTGQFTDSRIADVASAKITGTITPSDNTVTTAKITDANVTLAKLSATGTKDATTFLRGDNTFQTVSSDYVKIATTNITSGVSSVTFDGYFSSTYLNYVVEVNNLRIDTDGQYLKFRFRRSNSDLTATSYKYIVGRNAIKSGGIDSDWSTGAWNDNHIKLSQDLSNATSYAWNGSIKLYVPLSTGYFPVLTADSTTFNSTGSPTDFYRNTAAAVYMSANNPLSGFTIYIDSGNITNANINLYGIK